MKIKVREGMFETNSSSCHAICMCTKEDYDKWEKGELIYDEYNSELVSIEEIDKDDEYRYITEDEFYNDWDRIPYETYKDSYTTEDGKTIVAFGYYGHD